MIRKDVTALHIIDCTYAMPKLEYNCIMPGDATAEGGVSCVMCCTTTSSLVATRALIRDC